MSETTLSNCLCQNAPKGKEMIHFLIYKGRVSQVICPHRTKGLICSSPALPAKSDVICEFAQGYIVGELDDPVVEDSKR